MDFWHNLQLVAGYVPLQWLTLGFYTVVVLLYFYVPAERLRLRTAAILYALTLVGFILLALMQRGGMQQALSYEWIKWLARFIEWVAVVNVSCVLLFNVLLAAVRLRPPRIVIDL